MKIGKVSSEAYHFSQVPGVVSVQVLRVSNSEPLRGDCNSPDKSNVPLSVVVAEPTPSKLFILLFAPSATFK